MENDQILRQKLEKLKEMVTIITTNENEYKTALLLSEYYASSKKFEKAYASIIKKQKQMKNIKNIFQLLLVLVK